MGKAKKVVMALLVCALLLSLIPLPTYAYWPWWIERILRLIRGPVPASPPAATPPPAMPTPTPVEVIPTYTVSSLQEGIKLLKELEPGRRVKVLINEDDVNRLLAREVRRDKDATEARVDFKEGYVVVYARVKASWFRRWGPRFVPFRGELDITAEVTAEPRNCWPAVKLLRFEVNGHTTFWGRVLGRYVYGLSRRYWARVPFCVEEIEITEDYLALVGYKTRAR